MYAFRTENRFNQWLIFPSLESLLNWARAATLLTDEEIMERSERLLKTGDYYSLFPNFRRK